MIRTIRLPGGEYAYDDAERLGAPGGFGEVFRGRGLGNEAVAIKRLKLTAGNAAHRELAIARELPRTALHVVPVLDAGADAESNNYFVVMPVCDGNLQESISRLVSGMPVDEALIVMRAIVAGLLEVNKIVHRDLKPGNVLFHDGKWKIADFGIAKFVEDSTSLETLRNSLTPAYAAPEQWRGERPTHETDVYALGCILHALVTGKPPFGGTLDDVRDGHLNRVAPPLSGAPDALAAFAAQMLRKQPAGRPTLSRCQSVFAQTFDHAHSQANSHIADAARAVASREAEEEAAREAAAATVKARANLFDEAKAHIDSMVIKLFNSISNVADTATIDKRKRALKFGNAEFVMDECRQLNPSALQARGNALYRDLNWDIICGTTVVLKMQGPTFYAPSATLLYADMRSGSGFRWYEAAFFNAMGGSRGEGDEPFGLSFTSDDFFYALGRGVHSIAAAYGPIPIDAEDESAFLTRWLRNISRAAKGELTRPRYFPIKDLG